MKTSRGAHALAWLTFAFGIGVSIAGNIGHAASDGMKPGEWAGAAFWPLALMLSIEILTRVRWQPEARWIVARLSGLVLVALVAAVLSYLHLRGLLLYWGEGVFQSSIGPLAVDGLMLIAATALLSISKEHGVEPKTVEDVPVPEPELVNDEPEPVEDDHDWADASQISVADPEYLEQLDPQPEKPERLHVVENVSVTDREEAARQAWIASEGKLSVREVADLMGTSASTAHRRINERWRIQR